LRRMLGIHMVCDRGLEQDSSHCHFWEHWFQ
jgi:hypothetical protein